MRRAALRGPRRGVSNYPNPLPRRRQSGRRGVEWPRAGRQRSRGFIPAVNVHQHL